MSVRILIVDDHEIVRNGIRSILQAEAVSLAKELHPDAVILDVTMPVMGGLAAASQILQFNRDVRVLIFTMHESTTLSKLVQKSGAQGLVVKSQASRNLIQALEKLLAGETFFPVESGDRYQESKGVY
jgi:DNA-binding NarL/FixJ family response regulator